MKIKKILNIHKEYAPRLSALQCAKKYKVSQTHKELAPEELKKLLDGVVSETLEIFDRFDKNGQKIFAAELEKAKSQINEGHKLTPMIQKAEEILSHTSELIGLHCAQRACENTTNKLAVKALITNYKKIVPLNFDNLMAHGRSLWEQNKLTAHINQVNILLQKTLNKEV